MCCGTGRERIARHNNLCDALFAAAVGAGLGPTREERFLLPGSDCRPGDIFIPHWTGGRDTALYVTVGHPLQSALVARASTSPGSALHHTHDVKMSKAGEACRRQGIEFLPLALESLGGWSEVAENQVRKLGSALARQTGDEEAVCKQRRFRNSP